jgi:hypothetical protein
MNDTQLYLAIGIPSFLVVLAWMTSMVQTSRLADQNAKLSDKLDRLAEQQHKDALTLMGYMVPLHERLATVEAKQGAK